MRIGLNPNKDTKLIRNEFIHHIVIPVYIPNQEEYFKGSFDVLKLHFESVFKTVHSKTFISVINNGCCNEVKSYLDELFHQKKINEIIHTDNIGKINAILKGMMGHSFQFITITDCDVLFEPNWQQATYDIFNAFPKAGVVGLTPTIKTNYILTSNVLFRHFFSKKMKFSKVVDEDSMQLFYKSVGNEEKFIAEKNKRYFVLQKENLKVCVGCGHYVATYKSDIFKSVKKSSQFKMAGDMKKHFDEKLLRFGLWRLNTLANYAFHMGNSPEPWMYDKKANLPQENNSTPNVKPFQKPKELSFLTHFFTNTITSKFFKIIKFRRFFEKLKHDES
ncbi:glycosyltransferase family A protein [Flavobacterium sp.]|uniref:glycosyltransferase family A protein n=1 Tax=Flavobacterium sp. TaxID=239 RepID=UPI002B4AF6CA|nr:glycosyltransferase family A protein [Flavobacterium sp.]HLP63689.1 glycosyltransferase family A protein [Flavobacterium sp.]